MVPKTTIIVISYSYDFVKGVVCVVLSSVIEIKVCFDDNSLFNKLASWLKYHHGVLLLTISMSTFLKAMIGAVPTR